MDEATCVHFVVEGIRVFAQAILDGRSIYFNALLSNANISCSEPEEILVAGIKHSTFISILEFMNTGKFNCSLTTSTILELYLSTLLFMQNL